METVNQSFKDYKDKFKAVLNVMMPLFILQLVMAALILAGVFLADSFDTTAALFGALGLGVLGIIISIIMFLIYVPATIRVFQRWEEGEVITIHDAVAVHRKPAEIWKFFKAFLLISVASLFYMLMIFLPSILLVAGAVSFGLIDNLALGILCVIGGIAITIYLAIINIPKLLYMLNVYTSTKNLGAWGSLKESVRIGKKYKFQVWGAVGGITIFTIIGAFAQAVFSFLIAPQTFLETYRAALQDRVYTEPMYSMIGSTLVSALISVFFTTAIMYMYLSKKYQQARVMDDAGAKDEEVIPVIPQV